MYVGLCFVVMVEYVDCANSLGREGDVIFFGKSLCLNLAIVLDAIYYNVRHVAVISVVPVCKLVIKKMGCRSRVFGVIFGRISACRSTCFVVIYVNVLKGDSSAPGASVVASEVYERVACANTRTVLIDISIYYVKFTESYYLNTLNIAVYNISVVKTLMRVKTGNVGVRVGKVFAEVSTCSTPTSAVGHRENRIFSFFGNRKMCICVNVEVRLITVVKGYVVRVDKRNLIG